MQTRQFDLWLRQPDHYRHVEAMAAGIYKKLQLKGISIPGIDLRLSLDPEKEICQELFVFLLSEPGIQKELMTGSPGILIRVSRYFMNRIIDRVRGKENNQDIYKDTWRLFYRHVYHVLDHSDLFVKFKTPGSGLCFGRTQKASVRLVFPEDLLFVSYPENIPATLETVKTKQNILKLAVHYWDQCAWITGEPGIRINLKDFVAWISRFVPLQAQVESEWSFAETNPKLLEDDHFFFNSNEKGAQDLLETKYLKTWADNFSQQLNEKEKQVFYYYECQGLKGREISILMGQKSNLNYQRDKLRQKLKNFLSCLEWALPELQEQGGDRDQQPLIFFITAVCSLLGDEIKI